MARDERCKCQKQHTCDENMFKADSANQDRCDLTLKFGRTFKNYMLHRMRIFLCGKHTGAAALGFC